MERGHHVVVVDDKKKINSWRVKQWSKAPLLFSMIWCAILHSLAPHNEMTPLKSNNLWSFLYHNISQSIWPIFRCINFAA
jgi:hypothetical protein